MSVPEDAVGDGEMMELMRSRHPEELEAATTILHDAGISSRTSTTRPIYDITAVGSGGQARGDEVLVVRAGDFARARQALESAYAAEPLPKGHFLLNATDSDLAEILGEPEEWSAFDVAHAKRLAAERQLNLNLVKEVEEQHLKRLEQGKPASQWQIVVGFLLALSSPLLGGWGALIGLLVGWSLVNLRQNTPRGRFFVYDKRSREIGKILILLSIVSMILMLLSPMLIEYYWPKR